MSSMAAVRAFAAAYAVRGTPLNVLVNNAGAMLHERATTAEGVEANFATNTLGVFALTEVLLPLLERSAPAKVTTRPQLALLGTVASGGQLLRAGTANGLSEPVCFVFEWGSPN